jgi:uncharacterized membrane protein YphA (DoxX/SURF4 family)
MNRTSSWIVLIRLAVGWVFFSEGLQKFLFPETLGFGRFRQIGIPVPGFTAPLVGMIEVVCGLLLIAGLFTRFAVIPLLIDMAVAVAKTKLPILRQSGFWAMAHEARTDYAMVMGCLFLLAVGAGPISMDAVLAAKRRRETAGAPKTDIPPSPKLSA